MVSVLTAVETEAKAVRAALRGRADVLVLAVGVRAGRVPGGLSGTVIVAGLGGGLDPSLRPGDVVVDGWPDDRDLPTGARRGTIVTAEAVCATPSDKAALFRQTGAAAVDMEQAIVRRAVGEGARVVGVRAVLDPADQCLDPELVGLVDERGRPRLFRVAAMIAKRPGAVGELMRLGATSRDACERLGAVVAACVRALRTGEHPSG